MKVLIVDDEVIVARALSRAFQSKRHEVAVAHSGEEGLESWIAFSPDVILLDVVMPGLTGPQVIEEYGKRVGATPRSAVILMSAHSGIKGRSEALSLGADDFVQKPFENIFNLVDHIIVLTGKKMGNAR